MRFTVAGIRARDTASHPCDTYGTRSSYTPYNTGVTASVALVEVVAGWMPTDSDSCHALSALVP